MMLPTVVIAPHSQRFLRRIANVHSLKWIGSTSRRHSLACPDRRHPRLSPTLFALVTSSTKCPSQWSSCGPSINSRWGQLRCASGSSGGSSYSHLPPRMTIERAARLFRESKLTSQQLCQHFHNLAHFGENSLLLNAYAKLLPLDQVLEQAQKSDERIRNGTPKSLLDGVPVTIKANIAVGRFWEMPNACSAILTQDDQEKNVTNKQNEGGDDCTSKDNVYESDIAKRLLKDCGAVIIGITNMDEFGMGSLGINNGLHHKHQGINQTTQQNQYSPTYNPVPWMQRLSSLLDSQNQGHLAGDDEEDDYWMQQIQSSTPGNPHGVHDKSALADLLDEVQYWVCGNNSEKKKNRNNNDEESPLMSPGGSSSGAAATSAHGSSLLSIGTDTGGSIRLPSAWTSTIGFKPSYGTWSRYGVVGYASSLDTVGFITGTTECAEIAWRCLRNKNKSSEGGIIGGWNGQMSRDSTARVYHNESKVGNDGNTNVMDQSSTTIAKPLGNIRVGIPSAFSLQELPPLIADAWSESADCLQNVGGATLVSISESKLSSELIKLALASYYVLACAEASSNLSRYDGVRYGMDLDPEAYNLDSIDSTDFGPLVDMTALEQQISATRAYGFGEEIQRRVLAGTSVLSSDRFHTHYEAAAVVRAKLSRSLEETFRNNGEHDENDKVDAMLVPTALSFPCILNPIRGDENISEKIDPTAAFANDVMTIPISLGGFPSISVPAGGGRNLIGMQIFASKGSEDMVLRIANALQRSHGKRRKKESKTYEPN